MACLRSERAVAAVQSGLRGIQQVGIDTHFPFLLLSTVNTQNIIYYRERRGGREEGERDLKEDRLAHNLESSVICSLVLFFVS